jgi:beta-mannosidase
MFANMDYPFDDPDFRALVGEELDSLIDVIGGRPSTFCVCGGSEIEQQVAMVGLDPALGRPPFFADEVPNALAEAEVDALYVPSAPCGADRPLIPSQGVSNWFGVGGYLRPFSEIRSAGVRFASECLAIANVGDDVPELNDPAWKRGVAKDVGTDWDFDDVRDHYLKLLYEVDPEELHASDPDRYLELSRRVSGDVMAEVFGEWRRPESGCGGGFVLWLRDLFGRFVTSSRRSQSG